MKPPEDAAAYLITFTCHGTWLHGDGRGSMHRRGRDDTTLVPPNAARHQSSKRRLLGEPQRLDARRRKVVRAAIEEACSFKGWFVHALNVRTNHVHLVVSADVVPERVVSTVKARATFRLREKRLLDAREDMWTRHGSTIYLWREVDVTSACWYVMEGQGPDLPEADPGAAID